MSMIDFVIRGNGVAVDDHWMKKRSVKKKLAKRLDNGCAWFHKAFDMDADAFNKVVLKSGQAELMIDVWELKTLIDFIETKEYLNFSGDEVK